MSNDLPELVGILNITPDSFSDGGQFLKPKLAIKQAQKLIADGATWLDIGAQSSHPSSMVITAEEEWQRLRPVLAEIIKLGVPISVDTYKAEVAKKSLELGVKMINDITALRGDEQMIEVLKDSDCKVCLMFNKSGELQKGSFKEQKYDDIIVEISEFFKERISFCEKNGINSNRLVLDPGMGYFLSSNPQVSIEVLRCLPELIKQFEQPFLIGISRKSFVGILTGIENPAERSQASAKLEVLAIEQGIKFIRTHDIAAIMAALSAKNADVPMSLR